MSISPYMIEAEGLSKKFDDFVAVDSISFQVKLGEILVLLGPNGAGKTTTIRMLTSILKPTAGWAKVGGFDVVAHPNEVRNVVGVLTEHHGLYGRMNALDYLLFFSRLYRLPESVAKPRILSLLEKFGLSDAVKKRLGEYSKGMRQKLALVRTLLHEPPVILLDEPTSAMDPESARIVRDAIKGLRSSERTIILCTHNLKEAEELADRVAIIQSGRIILNDQLGSIQRDLAGEPEFEIRFTQSLNGNFPTSLPGVNITASGDDWIKFKSADPDKTNPLLLTMLCNQGLPVRTIEEQKQSLEDIYLRTVTRGK